MRSCRACRGWQTRHTSSKRSPKSSAPAASDTHLRGDASETTVKRTPLAVYKIVYFATHRLVAGDVKGLAEPSLALTIPAQARAYLAGCQAREAAEREEKEAALAREQAQVARTKKLQKRAAWALAALAVVVVFGLGFGLLQYRTLHHAQANLATAQTQLNHAQVNWLSELSTAEQLRGHWLGALRFAVRAARLDLLQDRNAVTARATLAATVVQSDLILAGHEGGVTSAAGFSRA